MAGEVLEVLLRVQDNASAPLRAAGQAALQATPQVNGLRVATQAVGTTSATTGSQVSVLAQMLSSRLAPDVIRSTAAMTDSTAVLGRFGGVMQLLAGAGGGVILPVTIAIGALGLAYRKLAKDVAEAEEAQKKAAARAKEMQEIGANLERKRTIATLRSRIAEGDESAKAELEGLQARMQAEADFADMAAAANLRLADARKKLTDATAELREIEARGGSVEEAKEAAARVQGMTELVQEQEKEFRKLSLEIDIHAGNILTAEHRTEDETDAIEKNTAALRTNREEREKMPGTSPWGPGSIPQAPVQIDSFGTGLANANFQTELTERAIREDRLAAEAEARQQRVNLGLSLGQAAVGGNVAAIGSLLGGPLLGGGMDILGSLGEQGAAGVGEGLKISSKSIIEGLKELPKFIGEVLPDLVTGIMEGLIAAIPVFLEQLPTALLELGYFLLMELPRAIAEAIKEQGEKGVRRGAGAISELFGDSGLFKSVSDAISSGGFAEGSHYISKTGLAVVHQGEIVDPEGGRYTRGRGGGGVTIQINGYVGPEALAELDRQMRAYAGLGMTWGS